jgi:sugar lactone lactonase YvrE
VLALRDGFYRHDLASAPVGRFVAGSMHMNLRPDEAPLAPLGALYRLEPDGQVTQLAGGIVTANGPCFSPDGRSLYLADSPRRVIWRFDYGDGPPTNRRALIDLASLDTAPDGATVDAEGHLWVALVRSGEIGRFNPAGHLVQRIRMPVRHPTSLNFGGPELDVLFVTSISASHRLADPAPEAGGLFAVTGLGVTGLAEPLIAA